MNDGNKSSYQRAKEKFDGLREDASIYFENNKDLIAASEFEAAMAMGCFDREFMYFATAFKDQNGIAYRISAKELRLQQFVERAAVEGFYPTPVKRTIRRRPCPSGHEAAIRQAVKVEAAKSLRAVYNSAYFEALGQLSVIQPNDEAYALLKAWQDELEGVYDREQLALYQSLLLTALESKVLTIRHYLEIDTWLQAVYKELEDDIIAKGLYKKTLSGFAYRQAEQDWQYFYDAKLEVTYEKQALLRQQGYQTSPIFKREKWLKDMSEFRQMREQFIADYKWYCDQGYLARLEKIKKLPGVISRQTFDEQLAVVKKECSQEAAEVFASYSSVWNVK